ncbi:hypothetical protein DSCA_44580 [Desulfosarcina alkanivorans]|jgi:hypothetical protein|uniref:Flagellar assembly protein T C-terminal domain-containing protein n=1 Tax=Desulfosarcina alkanivorans TaxID=571177 RepID=A0A5K7YP02_9BACT|nr:hypothetical protein [Desulfosarcina alkanivorans]BBO70528.1 hypothetical protein DSCA_44580 [Desulfosarcina alkanivorans]
MIAVSGLKTKLLLLLVPILVCGCGTSTSYRPADQKTIRDFTGGSGYRKTVGVMALLNTTRFTSDQVALPFMTVFLSSMESTASGALLDVPGKAGAPPFLWNPPRLANGDLDVFTLSGLVRAEGMNAVVSPLLLDIRVRKRDTGFWIFKDVAYSLQIQTAAAIYDGITGARLALGILTDEVDIDEYEAGLIREGQELQVPDLVEVAEEMGEALGERMGDAISDSSWRASVHSIEDGACIIQVGAEAGIQAGDRFTVLDGSRVLTGLDGQRYIVPGAKIGDISIGRVGPRQAAGVTETGAVPPVGSILVPGQ